MAEQNFVTPFVGMWLSIFVIAPISYFLTIKAKNDSPVIDGEVYRNTLNKFKHYILRKK